MLGGTLSTSPAQFTASVFVNKTKTTLHAYTVDKNTSSVCRSKRRFRPKPHAPVLILSIYRDTVPLSLWFCFLLHSILLFISQTSYRTYKIISSYELAVM